MDEHKHMNKDQFDTIMKRFEDIEQNMVKKADVYQSVLTVQGFMFAVIVGVIVVLNSVIGFT